MEPEDILARNDLVEGDEGPGLHRNSQKQILPQQESTQEYDTHLGHKGKDAHDDTCLGVVGLVYKHPVHREVVAVVFAFKVVQERLVKALIPVNVIEQPSEKQKSRRRHNRENNAISGEEVVENQIHGGCLAAQDGFFVAVNVQVEG